MTSQIEDARGAVFEFHGSFHGPASGFYITGEVERTNVLESIPD